MERATAAGVLSAALPPASPALAPASVATLGKATPVRSFGLTQRQFTFSARISALDGHFLHGRWLFSTDGSSAKARHLRARQAVSASYLPGEEFGVFTHGHARFLEPQSPDFEPAIAHLTAHYGASPLSWGDDIVVCRIEPTWMVGFAA